MNKKKLIIFILILVITYILLPKYAQRALIYFKPGIDDYKIFHNRVVETNSPSSWKYHYNYNKVSVPDSYSDFFKDYKTTAYAIVLNNKLLFEKYWSGYSDSSLTNSFSTTKSIVSILTGIAIKKGHIKSEDQYVYEFIEEYNTKENRNLQIKHLLTMSSGLNWEESYGSLFNNTTEAYYGNDLHGLISDLKVTERPGIKFKYLSGNTQVLAEIIKNATGKNLSEFASQELWGKINAKNNALWSLDDKDGQEKAYCCFNSNATDFARIGQLLINNGYWDSTKILDSSFISKIFTPASYLKNKKGKPVNFYSYHWWKLNHKGLDITYARGILGQYIVVIPEKQMVIVRLGKKRNSKKTGKHPNCIFTYIDAALKMTKSIKP